MTGDRRTMVVRCPVHDVEVTVPATQRSTLRHAVAVAEVACRESKKPHFSVVLAIADKPNQGPAKGAKAG